MKTWPVFYWKTSKINLERWRINSHHFVKLIRKMTDCGLRAFPSPCIIFRKIWSEYPQLMSNPSKNCSWRSSPYSDQTLQRIFQTDFHSSFYSWKNLIFQAFLTGAYTLNLRNRLQGARSGCHMQLTAFHFSFKFNWQLSRSAVFHIKHIIYYQYKYHLTLTV